VKSNQAAVAMGPLERWSGASAEPFALEGGQALVVPLGERWIGASSEPFARIADAVDVRRTDGDYRASTGIFFVAHRGTARVATLNASPTIRAVVEMYRLRGNLHWRTFGDEPSARDWLRDGGIAA
jgi:hypothetical protein